ncbi:MAG: acyltransferase [Verrucomicrobia bacterium]|nr:acyltransferase [Verrucomicrobiota bacterium]MBI3870798.1 acyltransferase [Verrucomicrobiota bacterium]
MAKFILRRVFNRVFHAIARVAPGSTTLRPTLHRWRGAQIGRGVFIGDDVYIDNEYPECVEIQEGAQISLRTSIIAHTRGSGRVIIEKNAFVGPHCVLVCGAGKTLRIAAGAVVGAGSVITRSVPPGLFVSPDPPKPIARAQVPLPVAKSMAEFWAGLIPLSRPLPSPPPAPESERPPA